MPCRLAGSRMCLTLLCSASCDTEWAQGSARSGAQELDWEEFSPCLQGSRNTNQSPGTFPEGEASPATHHGFTPHKAQGPLCEHSQSCGKHGKLRRKWPTMPWKNHSQNFTFWKYRVFLEDLDPLTGVLDCEAHLGFSALHRGMNRSVPFCVWSLPGSSPQLPPSFLGSTAHPFNIPHQMSGIQLQFLLSDNNLLPRNRLTAFSIKKSFLGILFWDCKLLYSQSLWFCNFK